MFYEGVARDGRRSIGVAVSRDGQTGWTRHPQPILGPSEQAGSWDGASVGAPCAVPMAGGLLWPPCRPLLEDAVPNHPGHSGWLACIWESRPWCRCRRWKVQAAMQLAGRPMCGCSAAIFGAAGLGVQVSGWMRSPSSQQHLQRFADNLTGSKHASDKPEA